MFIPTDDTCCFSCKGTLEEFIIRRIMLYHWRKAGREHNFRVNGQKIDEGPWIDLGKSRGELKHDPMVFLQDCRRDKNLNLAITPCLENPIWRPLKKTPETNTFVSRTTFTCGLELSPVQRLHPLSSDQTCELVAGPGESGRQNLLWRVPKELSGLPHPDLQPQQTAAMKSEHFSRS